MKKEEMGYVVKRKRCEIEAIKEKGGERNVNGMQSE